MNSPQYRLSCTECKSALSPFLQYIWCLGADKCIHITENVDAEVSKQHHCELQETGSPPTVPKSLSLLNYSLLVYNAHLVCCLFPRKATNWVEWDILIPLQAKRLENIRVTIFKFLRKIWNFCSDSGQKKGTLFSKVIIKAFCVCRGSLVLTCWYYPSFLITLHFKKK